MLKYCKIISFGLLCFGLTITTSSEIKADYFTDYNTTVMDTVLKDNIFNFDLFSRTRNYSLPTIKNNVIQSSMDELEYSAELLNYKKNAHNYLIFHSLDNNNIPNEMFRIQLKKSGAGKIVDKSLLKLLVPNSRIIMNVMSYEIDNKGNIENLEYSKSSQVYFTKKNINLVVTEGSKEVVNRTIELKNIPKDDKVSVSPYEVEQYYRPDKYYSYTKAKILVDGKEISTENMELPYLSKKIEVKLAQDKDYWNNVKLEYPSEFKKNDKEFLIKQGVTFANFIKENNIKEISGNNSSYDFSGYYLDDKEVANTQVLGNNIKIKAKYNTKVILDNGITKKEVTLLTDQKLSELDTKFFEKEKYHVDSYTILDVKNNSKIKEIKDLSEVSIDNSIILKANYKENTNTIKIRQDDYNKRFGKVDDSIKDKDIEWPETKKIGELLADLRKKIKPSSGYEVLFRSNKKVISDDDYITAETVLEIYFKKVDSEWVNVKFVGRGIDKFLSDGQDVLVGSRIDSMINLPTATGVTEQEFLGWQANSDYLIAGENSENIKVSKKRLLQTNELGAVVTEKGKDIEFTAVYRKLFNVEFEKTFAGNINLSKGTSNVLRVDEFNSIGDATKNNKLIVAPKSGYTLSHFTANKTVKVNMDKGTREIFVGQKIEEKDLYNIVPTSDLKITPVFKLSVIPSTLEEMIENNKIKTVDDALDLKFESTENIKKILGPLYYLR
ncbi:hypothetical protein [uncultured Gemella sp.]|uniref:hypothetical protein n=1 Tax=uncultured Gemella sp. TaxID=254352 RepID=UPI0025EF1768|nr:hypothetical protein [uncultured Gemella sp.]